MQCIRSSSSRRWLQKHGRRVLSPNAGRAFSSSSSSSSSSSLQWREDILGNTERLPFLRDQAEAWASCNGLMMADSSTTHGFTHAPYTLLPSPISTQAFEQAHYLAGPSGAVMNAVSRDMDFLFDIHEAVAKVDPFANALLTLLKKLHTEQALNPLQLGLFRSDYMLHEGTDLLQIEVNTIASSFGCLSTKVSALHKFMLNRHAAHGPPATSLPFNNVIHGFADTLASAHKASPVSQASQSAVLMVVQPGETNVADQRLIEFALADRGIPVVRRSLAEVHSLGLLDASSGDLTVDGHSISVAYFRAGYAPTDFPTELEWAGLELIERSSSISCPPVNLHLAGSKKIQQALCDPGLLKGFVTTFADTDAHAEQITKDLQQTFAGIWSLDQDNAETRDIIEMALAAPDSYVLKPQREGGGNNFWGPELVSTLSNATVEQRSAYILMQRIMPQAAPNVLLRAREPLVVSPAVSELGMYSGHLSSADDTIVNNQLGHLLRTKVDGVNEGGVASKHAVLDSPVLV